MRADISRVQAGSEHTVAGKVIRTFEARGKFAATIIDGTGTITVFSNSPFSLDSLIIAEGKARRRKSLELDAERVSELPGQEHEALLGGITSLVEKGSQPTESRPLVQDPVMKSLQKKISECASRILKAKLTLRPIVLRYHGDADGVCGALALAGAIGKTQGRFLSFQNNGAVYALPDVLRDINFLRSFGESTGDPLFLLVDFSSNVESADSLDVLKGSGAEIILIDHHPLDPAVSEIVDCVLSPSAISAASYYTAGLLAGEVSKAMGGPDVSGLQRISLAGDKSDLSDKGPEALKKALVINYLGRYSKFPNTLDFYLSVLSKQGMIDSIYAQASAKTDRALRVAREFLKVKELPNGFRLCLINLQKTSKPNTFPGRGMLCGALHDQVRAEMSGPLVTIGYSDRLITMRANQEARDRGFDANAIINDIKRELVNSIETGGGHDVAASLHVNDGFENIVLEEVIRHVRSL